MTGFVNIVFGAKNITSFLCLDQNDRGDVAKINRLLSKGEIPGAFRLGRQYALDKEIAADAFRARAAAGLTDAPARHQAA